MQPGGPVPRYNGMPCFYAKQDALCPANRMSRFLGKAFSLLSMQQEAPFPRKNGMPCFDAKQDALLGYTKTCILCKAG